MDERKVKLNNDKLHKMAHRRESKYILTAFVVVLFLLVVWGICIVAGSFSEVKKITVNGDSPYSENQIIAVAGIQKGSKLNRIDSRKSESDILDNLTYIVDVKIKKKLGGNVVIDVTSDQASYISNISNDYFVMSDNFRVLGYAGDFVLDDSTVFIELPPVKKALVGDDVIFYEDTSYIFEFIDIMSGSSIAHGIISFDVSDRYNLSVVYDDCYVIRFGEMKDMDAKLRKLDVVLNSDAMAGLDKAIIDISDISAPSVTPQ